MHTDVHVHHQIKCKIPFDEIYIFRLNILSAGDSTGIERYFQNFDCLSMHGKHKNRKNSDYIIQALVLF